MQQYQLSNIQENFSFEIFSLPDYIEQRGEELMVSHTQDYYQIIWFKSGCGLYTVDFNEYNVFENALFFIAKSQVHSFKSLTKCDGFVINFGESFLVQKDNDVDFFLKCNLFNTLYQTPSCCVGSGWEFKLDEYISQMRLELAEKKSYGREELLRLYLKAFLIQVQRRKHQLEEIGSGRNPFPDDEKRNLLIKFINAVEDNFAKNLTVSQYSALLNISTRTLSNLTLLLIQKTPTQIIQERIILESKRLLTHSDISVKEIAYRIGFKDPAYFFRYFKKHTEISPINFRKSIR
ncbi:4-hydroxyphenylacetate catabolism regulatory protein HpaA [Aquimarina muelleri]|uniref:4-hydroxyphenylacetate catabolism regulatory protein HpaA n=2 Tax=Aquimarina muelleri TaxID=279356 RepID=A0A918JZ03_9FLAO|nr:4-hydroxyphenylacetate catabolism regulatory protein HpaA [Aquimarina muelleri]